MKKISNIFHEKNFILQEYHSKTNKFKKTERLKLEVLNENQITLQINLSGKDLPTYVEAILKLSTKQTGELNLLVECIGDVTLSCLDLSTKSNEIGKDIRLYRGRDSANLILKEDSYISFKFTYYTNYDRMGKIKISCV